MRFAINSYKKNNIDFIQLNNESTGESAEILPGLGGTVQSLNLFCKGNLRSVLLGDSLEELPLNPYFRGRLLFPFNDVIPKGHYFFGGQNHQLELNSQKDDFSIHGMLSKQSLSFAEQSFQEKSCSVTLRYSIYPLTFTGYPFSIDLTVTYSLHHCMFSMLFTIKNTGTIKAPVSPGWHPYFTFNGSLQGTALFMQSHQYVEVDKNLIPTQKLLPCKNSHLDFTTGKEAQPLELDIPIVAPADGRIRLTNGEYSIVIEQDTALFKYVQLFTPPDHNSIAIEPICAPTNSFNFHTMGLKIVEPGENVSAEVRVLVE